MTPQQKKARHLALAGDLASQYLPPTEAGEVIGTDRFPGLFSKAFQVMENRRSRGSKSGRYRADRDGITTPPLPIPLVEAILPVP